MHRALLLVLILAFGALAAPAGAIVPLPPPPEPARLAAAQRFVAVLPIRESFVPPFGASRVVNFMFNDLIGFVRVQHPRLNADRIEFAMRFRVDGRVEQVLPEILPIAAGDIATAYAYQLSVAELDAAATYFGSDIGRPFARRLVEQDNVIFYSLRNRLYQRLQPEVEALLAEAERTVALRERVNAGGR